MRRTLLVAAVAVVVASVVPGVAQAAPGALRWGACPADVTAPGLECTTLEVPLDYRKPDGRQIQVAVSRLKSANPAHRRGVLLTNPGGPGGPGLDMPALLALIGLPQSLLDTYDVIGFDPRGVGHSTPVTCDLAPAQLRSNVPPYALGPADVAAHAEYVQGVARQCGASRTAAMLPYVTTANTARDMDRIRAALGEPKLSYYGISYGTYLGAVYTTLFPQRSDRIVLDSNLAPGGLDVTGSRLFAQGFDDRFPDFAAFAVAHQEFGLGRTRAEVTAKYFDLAARLDAKPSPEGVDGKLFRQLTFGMFYSDATLPYLASAWHALDTGAPVPQPPGGTVPDLDNLLSSQLYVVCGDSAWPEPVRTYQKNVAIDRIRHPMFGPAAANIWPCAFWPSEPAEPQVRIGDRGPSDILMLQNLRDPATPLTGARQLRRAFGDRARMVTADQGGHGTFFFGGNTCANNAGTKFLTTGELPPRDLACAAEPSHQAPAAALAAFPVRLF
ncbi:alpha/beta hydrolase [Amycolatopsis mongoliensis]|uniref:Alpha/beta hydrolase n=1 Tax=Amycolatopsis mongoliensis TaxID=715475 RepID=A0A9Y2JX80_9PSEU|nr:alpha/beta hydrolase [Amycolatopsis sp. 4-36]WIY05286.1 alpha/beta hydrolase [Amycolatopsis sp. 4-36]